MLDLIKKGALHIFLKEIIPYMQKGIANSLNQIYYDEFGWEYR
ncbi:hypothetical protein [Candidatus Rhabdochlamydia sp. T3358]|nr:hypothetical protein [Candidatus Rhabdochlamydia sp. T3358]